MAATETLEKISVTLKLDNGLSSTGSTKTVSVSFPAINKDTYDVAKVAAIAELTAPVLSKSIVSILKTSLHDIELD